MEKQRNERSNLQKMLESGHFAVTAEVGPPMSGSAENVENKAKKLAGLVDAANVTDNQTAIVRMSSIAASYLAMQNGVDPIVQVTCRDRNRIAIQSDLLGAYALGLRNVLVVSGDHQSFGNHPGAKNVYDVDSVQLLAGLDRLMREGEFMGGSPIKEPVNFYLGATANPFAHPAELQLMRLEKKIRAGAKFIQTQAVYNLEKFEVWMAQLRQRGLHEKAHILAGVIVNRSVRSMEGTAGVPGMEIPPEMIARMRAAGDDKDAQMAEGVAMALERIQRLRAVEGVAGVHIMAIGWESIVPTILERAGFLPRPVV